MTIEALARRAAAAGVAIQTLSSFAVAKTRRNRARIRPPPPPPPRERGPLSRGPALRSLHHTNEIVSHRGTEPDHPVKSTTRAKLPILHMEGMKDWERWLTGHLSPHPASG